jgi:hypothetical protein
MGTLERGADQVERAANSRPVGWAARAGLTARGFVYLLLGLLTLALAQGRHAEVDQKGAMKQLLAHPYGKILVIAMIVGFAGYAIWRLSEAAFGVTGEGKKVGPRIQSLVRGLIYAGLAVTGYALLHGSSSSQAGQQREITARVMQHTGGRWLVGTVGVVIAIVGLVLAWEGLRLRFMRYFPVGSLSPSTRRLVEVLGWVGNIARGLVFAVVGTLVVVAAVQFQPSKAGGLDAALKTLRDRNDGQVILLAISVGLIAFGLYGLLEARYRRV